MTKDQELILYLLCGRMVWDECGLPTQIYLKDGSPEELEARRALARMLRSSQPLDLGLKGVLADLVDPDRDEVNRKINFGNRREGKPSNAMAEIVAQYIEAMLQDGGETRQLKYAISKAADKFELNRSRLFEIWRDWKPTLKRLKR
jgi:hypothetical protein